MNLLPLARMASVLGRWGDGSELSTVVDMVRVLCSRTDTMAGGKTNYLNIRSYPAVLIFTAYGLGLTRSSRASHRSNYIKRSATSSFVDGRYVEIPDAEDTELAMYAVETVARRAEEFERLYDRFFTDIRKAS
jgi:hypothetical protein